MFLIVVVVFIGTEYLSVDIAVYFVRYSFYTVCSYFGKRDCTRCSMGDTKKTASSRLQAIQKVRTNKKVSGVDYICY